MNNITLNYLENYFDEVKPLEFYRRIFPKGELEQKGEQIQGKYNAIAVELMPPDSKPPVKRYIVNDDLDNLKELLESDNFIIISPISYCGRTRESKNARFIYALAFDLDGVETKSNIDELFYQFTEINKLPNPTFTVWSGNGLHLYYQFKKPLPCFDNIIKQLAILKRQLTYLMWNEYTTKLADNIQYESLFQGFRFVGGVCKDRTTRTRVFETGETVDIEYLNSFVEEKYQVKEYTYKSNLTLQEAAAKYPEWYERRIVNKQPKGIWQCKRDLFDWWKKKIKAAKVGHRYYYVMCLVVYAKKSGISRSELEDYAFSIVEELETLTKDENNHFTRADVLAALEMYNDNYIRFPIDSISKLTDIPIEKNKRNYRRQETHLKIARSVLSIMNEENGKALQGRKSKKNIVEQWQKEFPDGTKAECIRKTGLSKSTVYKYWV